MLEPVSCVWAENPLSDDNRAHYATNTLLNVAMDHAEVGMIHRNGFKDLPSNANGAIVVIHGEHQHQIADQLYAHVALLKWSLVINTGDEPGIFPLRAFTGSRRKVWMQFPVPGIHDYANRFLVASFPHDCPRLLYACGLQERIYDWNYMGQVNHALRRECVGVLRSLPRGFLHESPGFWQGLPRGEYYRVMAATKVVACPAGGCTPESLRIFEALEAGCVPVVEDRWPPGYPRQGRPGLTGYWRYVLGEEPPFPTVTDWHQFPRLLDEALRAWPANRDRLQIWWTDYKKRMAGWFEEDLRAII